MEYASNSDIVERALVSLLRPGQVTLGQPLKSAYERKFRPHKRNRREAPFSADPIPRPSRIFVQEILSDHTISICWSDSLTGHYAEQLWRLGLARVAGFCALSGRPITCGERVFRPRRSSMSVPSNWDRMVLASVISEQTQQLQ
ncbi:DUF3331 domain-containing protein [Paraburkholderia nemoris]|uniref:DUF3331 domain-containing protein n=1 Tax=Paraburkholderia nemoris TaxID=2793076 RepID=UPI0038B88F60